MNMKKIIIFSFLAFAFLISCNKEELVDNSEQLGISKITYYPIMTVKGDLFMSIAKGSAFTDPGATAMAGTAAATVTVAGSVNTNTIGTYSLVYTAINKDGYARSTNGSIAVWKKIAPGLYTVFNPGGAPGTNLTIHAFNTTGNTIIVPSQVSSDGSTTSCTNAAGGSNIVINTATNTYAWHVVNPGYGTSLRTFTKK